jgi:hypothetical protein
MSKMTEAKLRRENRSLRFSLEACLELIDELSNLDAPLFEAELSQEFKLKYVRIVKTAQQLLDKPH